MAEITGEIAHAWLRSASGPGRTVRTVLAIGQTFRATRADVEVFPLGAVKLAGIALIIAGVALLKSVI